MFEPREIGYKPIAIVSGYKPFGAKITEEIVDKYEKGAGKVLYKCINSVYNQFSGDLSPFLLQYFFENACKIYLNMLL